VDSDILTRESAARDSRSRSRACNTAVEIRPAARRNRENAAGVSWSSHVCNMGGRDKTGGGETLGLATMAVSWRCARL